MSKARSGGKPAAFLDPARITETLANLGRISEQAHVTMALAGGCALQIYGSTRFTQDVDVLAETDFGEMARGFRPRDPLSFGGRTYRTPNSVEVDVIVRDDDYASLYAEALIHAQRLAGVPIKVVTLPYLAAMKLAAGRGKDKQDLSFILLESGAPYRSVRALVKKHLGAYAANDLDSERAIAKLERKKK